MKNKSIVIILSLSILSVFSFTACNWSNAQKGGAIGAGTGAAVGGVIGAQSNNTAVGAIIGAAVGGAAGALIGDYVSAKESRSLLIQEYFLISIHIL